MSTSNEAPGARLRTLWRRLSPLPGGRWTFSRILGTMVPYSSTIGATVLRFEPGDVRIRMRDRRAVRNHLRSIHAIALANLGELSTGLAVLGALGPTTRGILTGLEVEYVKKARGTLIADARCQVSDVAATVEERVEATIRDDSDEVVAVVTARWRLSPRPGEGR